MLKATWKMDEIQLQDKTAVAIGFFDGLHLGHRALIDLACQSEQDADCRLIPAVLAISPVHLVLEEKQLGCIYTASQLVYLLEKCGVQYTAILPFEEISAMDDRGFVDFLADRLCAKIVCYTEDCQFLKGVLQNADRFRELASERGIEVRIGPSVVLDGQLVNSTVIKQLLDDGNIAQANRMLGQRYFIRSIVRPGKQNGRTIKFPTINQAFGEDVLIPRFGVYATIVKLDGRYLPAITNVGVKPTVGDGFSPLAETHILNFCRDLYGQEIEVDLVEYIRPERRFNSLEDLKEQIMLDCKKAVKIIENVM